MVYVVFSDVLCQDEQCWHNLLWGNLRRFMVVRYVGWYYAPPFNNSMSLIFFEKQFISVIFFQNCVEFNWQPMKLLPSWSEINFFIDSMDPKFSNFPKVIIWPISIFFRWFKLGRLHCLRFLWGQLNKTLKVTVL